jgi:signal transduction histidine kinase
MMDVLTVLRRRPAVFLLAGFGTAAILFVGEGSHWQSLGRIGVALAVAVGLPALYLVLRQSVMLEQQQRVSQRLVQAERERLETEVAQRTAQLTQLAHHLQTAREDERNRLARDLHDELGALLTSAKLDAARIKSRLAGQAPEALERLVHLVQTLDQVIALKRRIAEDLRPSALGNLGLASTLEILAREFAERSGVQVHCSVAPVKLTASAELTVYRLVQEAITNLSKYARAQHVWLSLASVDGQVQVAVRDDGVGFDARAMPVSAYGLLGMRFRVEAEGGTLEIVSAPGQGTQVIARLPAAPAHEAP